MKDWINEWLNEWTKGWMDELNRTHGMNGLMEGMDE